MKTDSGFPKPYLKLVYSQKENNFFETYEYTCKFHAIHELHDKKYCVSLPDEDFTCQANLISMDYEVKVHKKIGNKLITYFFTDTCMNWHHKKE